MRLLKLTILAAACGALLVPTSALAQGTAKPPATPAPTTPPAPAPAAPAPAAPAPAAKPPAPFPEGAKFAYVDIPYVAANSNEGKSSSAKIAALNKKKSDELTDKNKALTAAQTKLQQGGTVLSDAARSQLEKEIEKMQRELQFAQQDAQTEINELQQELQNGFQDKLSPVLEALRAEKGLLMIFSVRDSGIAAADVGLDLSAEVVKRLDAAVKADPKK
jgi:Skp family chaperone for outer membrane proteins